MAEVSVTTASLLHAGLRTTAVPGAAMTIGRGEDCEVVVAHERVSRAHARVFERGGWFVEDLGSRNGTFLNGERLGGAPRRLSSGDTITVAGEPLRFIGGEATRMASRALPVVGTQSVDFTGDRLTIGRDPANDVVLADPNVSRFHAEARARNGHAEIVDLGSRNGTRVEGELVERASLTAGAQIGIGPFRLVFDGIGFVARDDHGALRLDADGLTVEAGGKRILDGACLSVEPREFVVIIGESGAGKSTLIKTLAGVIAPARGRVLISGEPVAARLTDIGYVPQDEIVHGLLSVTEALHYAARLRLPQDASAPEIGETIDRVLDELALREQARTRIASLSGGQHKRTGVATELLNRPSLLFLDEPTTGLDPALESRMMVLLRALADNGRAVVVVTHATRNLAICDRVVVMGRGGHVTFNGSPDEALDFFCVDTFDAIYDALDAQGATTWRARFEAARAGDDTLGGERAEPTAPGAVRPHQERRVLPQARVLAARYARLVSRDRRNLALLLGQVPVIGIAIAGLFHSGLFEKPPQPGTSGNAVQLLFLVVTTVIWLGSIDASRELIKERSVFEREAAVGTRLGSYLLSKAVVLFALVAVQTLLLSAIVFAVQPLHTDVVAYLEVLAILLLTGFVSVAMGLLVSALASSQDQATSFIPLVLIPQLLFAGSIVAYQSMSAPVQALSTFVYSRWSFAGVGSAVGMNTRLAADPVARGKNRFGPDFFTLSTSTTCLILLAFMAVFFAAVALLVRRRAPR